MNTTSAVAAKLKRYKRRRRWRRIFSLAAAAFLALTGVLRLTGALQNFHYLKEIRLFPGPWYLISTGGARGLLFTTAFVMLLLRARAAPLFTRLTCTAYLLWMWVDRVYIGTREAFHFYLASALIISALTLIFAFVLVQPQDYP
jgi:hypothetical protein